MVIIKEDIQFVSFNPLIRQAKKKKNILLQSSHTQWCFALLSCMTTFLHASALPTLLLCSQSLISCLVIA